MNYNDNDEKERKGIGSAFPTVKNGSYQIDIGSCAEAEHDGASLQLPSG